MTDSGHCTAGRPSSSSGANYTATTSAGEEVVRHLDQFAKAKVINFIKRLSSSASSPSPVQTREIAGGGEGQQSVQYYARVRLPLPEEYGKDIYGEGFAVAEKDAEVAACMHAERIIDSCGYPVFLLSSKQKRHAEAAAAAGRWAPQPGDAPLDPSAVKTFSPPIHYVAAGGAATLKVEQQMHLDRVSFSTVRRGAFTPLKNTLISPYFYDGSSVFRVKQFLAAYQVVLERYCRVTALHKEAMRMQSNSRGQGETKFIPSLFVAQFRLPIDPKFGDRQCMGKAPTRREAIVLACMHAELTIDALGLMLFPQSPSDQIQHAKECKQAGRWCVEPGAFDFRYDAVSPPPLALDTERESSLLDNVAAARSTSNTHSASSTTAGGAAGVGHSPSSAATDGNGLLGRQSAATAELVDEHIHAGASSFPTAATTSIESTLVQHTRAVNEMYGVMNVSTVEPSARKLLLTYLSRFRSTTDSPFLVEALGQKLNETQRASVTVPLMTCNESFVAIGVSDDREEAECAAAMHALHTLSNLNQPWYSNSTGGDLADEPAATAFPDSIAAYAKMAAWPLYDPKGLLVKRLRDVGDSLFPPPIRSVGAHLGRISAPGLSADWRRRGQRLQRPSGHMFNDAEDRASGAISNEESTTKEIQQRRKKLAVLEWSLQADADDRIIVAPDASPRGRNYVHTLPSVRCPDLFAVKRLQDFLERHGKNIDACLSATQQAVNEGMRWVAKVQLPIPVKMMAKGCEGPAIRCVAQGEGYSRGDAICMCAMHAELLLDAMGVVLYDHPLLQRKHADTARTLGRWAPLHSGMRPPAVLGITLPSPLRKEHSGSDLWKNLVRSRAQGGDAGGFAAGSTPAPPTGGAAQTDEEKKAAQLRSTAEALRRLQEQRNAAETPSTSTTSSSQPASTTTTTTASSLSSPSAEDNGAPDEPTDDELCAIDTLQSIHPREVFRQSLKHVQFYFNNNGSDFQRTLRMYTVRDPRHGIVHRAIVEVPVPPGFGKRYAVACTAIKKMAAVVCASHAAWILDALGICIYRGRRQQLYATFGNQVGRKSPFPGDPLMPFDTPSPKGLCCLSSGARDAPEPPATPTMDAMKMDRRLWVPFVRACRTYLEKKKEYEVFDAVLELKRAPRREVAVEDDALDAVELLPLNRQARSQLPPLCSAAGLPPPGYFRYEPMGAAPNRMFYTELPVSGTPYQARGVATSGADSMQRAAMHYAYLVSNVAMRNTSSSLHGSGAASGNGTANTTTAPTRRHTLFDLAKSDFTSEGKQVLLDVFALTHRPFRPLQWQVKRARDDEGDQRSKNKKDGAAAASSNTMVVTVEWVDATEVHHKGRGEHRDIEDAVEAAVIDLHRCLLRNALFQATAALVRRRPDLRLSFLYGIAMRLEDETEKEGQKRPRVVGRAPEPPKSLTGVKLRLESLLAQENRWAAAEERQEPREGDHLPLSWRLPLSSTGTPSVPWLHNQASEGVLSVLLLAAGTPSSSTAAPDDTLCNTQTDLLRMGVVTPATPSGGRTSPASSVALSSIGVAATLLIQCFPSIVEEGGAEESASAAGGSDGGVVRLRPGALLPLQFAKLLVAGMMWGCTKECLRLISFIATCGGRVSASPEEAAASCGEEEEADVEGEEDADMVKLALMSESSEAAQVYERGVVQQLLSLCQHCEKKKEAGGPLHHLWKLLSDATKEMQSTTAAPQPPLEKRMNSSVELRLRACVAFATLPYIQPTITTTTAAGSAVSAMLTASFDGELQILSASAAGMVHRRWLLTVPIPFSLYLLTTNATTVPPCVVDEEVPALAILHNSFLLSTAGLGPQPDAAAAGGDSSGTVATNEAIVASLLPALHKKVAAQYSTLLPFPAKVRDEVLALARAVTVKSVGLPTPVTSEAGQGEKQER